MLISPRPREAACPCDGLRLEQLLTARTGILELRCHPLPFPDGLGTCERSFPHNVYIFQSERALKELSLDNDTVLHKICKASVSSSRTGTWVHRLCHVCREHTRVEAFLICRPCWFASAGLLKPYNISFGGYPSTQCAIPCRHP